MITQQMLPFTDAQTLGLSNHLTHKGNRRHTRYGWLRLTPAYSVHLVTELLGTLPDKAMVLDPFCGTGTTALVCAERGIRADTTDINPFLIWLAGVKTRPYSETELTAFQDASRRVVQAIVLAHDKPAWTPALHQIEKWWDERMLQALGRAMSAIEDVAAGGYTVFGDTAPAAVDLLRIVFCRMMIDSAHVSFGHQSMSFKKKPESASAYSAEGAAVKLWQEASRDVAETAKSAILSPPRALLCDARHLTEALPPEYYDCVITSPPYPNRMSYIRELRPYMYWLGYLRDGRAAGELDWQAIGGTWGCATSNVGKWTPEISRTIPFDGFQEILTAISHHSPLLSRYVHKYFYDMVEHIAEVRTVLKPGGRVNYIVGNSKFYDVLLPVEEIFAALFQASGFRDVQIKTIRKRTSKKELFEYVVSAQKP